MSNPRRIRILHIVRSMGVGGTEEGVRKLLLGLDPDRFEQTVCTVLANDPVEERTGARVVSLQQAENRGHLLVPDLARIFRREKPDIVHSRNWATIESVPAARLGGITAAIHSEHGLDVNSMHGQPWRRRMFRRWCFRWARRFFVVSESLRLYYAQQLNLPPAAILVIPNGVDAERFRPDPEARKAARERLQLSPDAVVIGTVSRLDPVKDHRTLFQAAESLVLGKIDVQLLIIGDGPERSSLEQYVRQNSRLSGRVRFLGEIQDVNFWLNAFDIFALPSLAEGMSNTLLEAMASGVAPVATAVGGNPEIIEEGRSGILVPAGDVKGLAASLKKLCRDESARIAMAEGARARIEARFSLQQMLNAYAQLYEDAVGKRVAEQPVSQPAPAMAAGRSVERPSAMGKAQ